MSNPKGKTSLTIGIHAVALVVVAAFCFHLSRYYLSVELCTHNAKDGNTLQHCKDVLGWLTAPRADLDEVSEPITHTVLPLIRAGSPPRPPGAYDISLPAPFHPPRILG